MADAFDREGKYNSNVTKRTVTPEIAQILICWEPLLEILWTSDVIVDSTINWTSELSEGTPIPDYHWFRRDSEIAPTEYMWTYLHNLL